MLPVRTPESAVTRLVPQAEDDAALIRLWLHGKAVHSQRAYSHDIDQFLLHVQKPLRQITLGDMQHYADALITAPASKRRSLGAVKSLFSFGQKLGYLAFNVGAALALRRAKDTLTERILDRDSITRLIALELEPRNRAILHLLYDAGLRVSELCQLRWNDLQARQDGCGQVTVYGKGDKTRTALISPRTFAFVKEIRCNAAHHDPIFPSRRGNTLDPSQVWRIVRAAAERAKVELPVSPHWLRHACASHALDGGAPVHLVQKQLGHSSLEVTTRYAHARPDDGLFRYLGK